MADDDLIRRGDVLDAVCSPFLSWQETADAIAALPAQGVRVKPLPWAEMGAEHLAAGDYKITPSYGQGPKRLMLSRGSNILGWADSIDQLQDWAQADYEACILAALAPAEAGKP